jgi:hypothetical protein
MGWQTRALTVAVASTLAVALPASVADADVLIDTSHLSGPCIVLGVWYQSFSGGPRTITATVYRGQARVARRQLTATTTWRFHSLACPPPGSYTIRLTGAGWHKSYSARVPLP